MLTHHHLTQPHALLATSILALLCLTAGCTATSHGAVTATAASASSPPRGWLSLANTPGKIELDTIESARWSVPREGLINLDHPRAKEAGLTNEDEQILVFMHQFQHPEEGTFLIDSGVAQSFEPGGQEPLVSSLLKERARLDQLDVRVSTAAWLRENPAPIQAVFLTHVHLDHILGVPDLPDNTKIYAGPEETTHREVMHLFTRGTTDQLLAGKPPIETIEFEPDPTGLFDGIKDLFGDGEVFLLQVAGHTPGSVAFLIRTTTGPVLITGDAAHTAWGWEHCVESGTFNKDGEQSAQSLKKLKALEERLPNLKVVLGHQRLEEGRSASNACGK